MKRYSAVIGLFSAMVTSGCLYELRDEFNECRLNCATRSAARSSWKTSSGACMGISCPHSFKEGFMAGYENVANGGNGCVPAVPIFSLHNHMWMDRCSESEKVAAWYDGWEIGAMSAKGDGMADSNRISTRLPQSADVDYSSGGRSQMNSSPAVPAAPRDNYSADTVIPPAPSTDPASLGGPQTRN